MHIPATINYKHETRKQRYDKVSFVVLRSTRSNVVALVASHNLIQFCLFIIVPRNLKNGVTH